MDYASLVYAAFAVSIAASAIVSVLILPPMRSVLRRLCPAEDAVAFWTRFSFLMLLLGPLLVTLIFGVPARDFSLRMSTAEQLLHVITAALVGSFLTLGGIGLRIGSVRPAAVFAPVPRKTDDQLMR